MRFSEARSFVETSALTVMYGPQPTGVLGLAIGALNDRPIIGATDFAIVAYVVRKLPAKELDRMGLVDAYSVCRRLARELDLDLRPGEVRIVEVGEEFRAQPYSGSSHADPAGVNTQKWFQALRPGIGIANPVGSYPGGLGQAGTIGFFVRDDQDVVYIVSCNHVLANGVAGKASVNPDPILQPATPDLSGRELSMSASINDLASRFQVAELTGIVPVTLNSVNGLPPNPMTNTVDAALAILKKDLDRGTDDLSMLPYGGKILGDADAYTTIAEYDREKVIGSPHVYKVGRTTGYTEGQVYEVVGTVRVNFAGGKATFPNVLAIKHTVDNTGPFSAEGDSGSALLTDDHKIAGLLFGGTSLRSLANPIASVMTELRAIVPSARIVT